MSPYTGRLVDRVPRLFPGELLHDTDWQPLRLAGMTEAEQRTTAAVSKELLHAKIRIWPKVREALTDSNVLKSVGR